MTFYRQLSRYYDEIFKSNASEMDFFIRQLHGRQDILDIACGTGNKTVLFKALGRNIVGIDMDQDMVNIAKQRHRAEGVAYLAVDMREIERHFAPQSFDAILCLGNSLVHMRPLAAVQEIINQTHTLLRKGGLLIIQIINYDRIVEHNIACLPTIETENVKFFRNYHWQNRQLHFATRLLIKKSGQELNNDIVLLALRQKQLAACLKRAGFGQCKYYGGFNGQPLEENSVPLIVTAHK